MSAVPGPGGWDLWPLDGTSHATPGMLAFTRRLQKGAREPSAGRSRRQQRGQKPVPKMIYDFGGKLPQNSDGARTILGKIDKKEIMSNE